MFGNKRTPISKSTASASASTNQSASAVIGPHNVAPPPGIDPLIWSRFLSVDTDRSGYITASGLQSALSNGNWAPFEIDTIKLLMNMFDTNENGTIDINEFDGLWRYIQAWESVFRHFDKSHNGTIDGDELRQALEQFGYKLSPPLQDLLKRKYDVPWISGGGPAAAPPGDRRASSRITFDRFMRACVVIKQLKESFEALDRDPYGRVKIDYDTFLSIFLKLP